MEEIKVGVFALIDNMLFMNLTYHDLFIKISIQFGSLKWKDSKLSDPSNYLCIVHHFDINHSTAYLLKIVEKDTLKDTKYFIYCPSRYIQIDSVNNRLKKIDYFIN